MLYNHIKYGCYGFMRQIILWAWGARRVREIAIIFKIICAPAHKRQDCNWGELISIFN